MLSLQIQNPLVESYLYEHFKDDTKQMSIFINDLIEKELIKKDVRFAFDELKEIMNKQRRGKSLQSLIEEISPK